MLRNRRREYVQVVKPATPYSPENELVQFSFCNHEVPISSVLVKNDYFVHFNLLFNTSILSRVTVTINP